MLKLKKEKVLCVDPRGTWSLKKGVIYEAELVHIKRRNSSPIQLIPMYKIKVPFRGYNIIVSPKRFKKA